MLVFYCVLGNRFSMLSCHIDEQTYFYVLCELNDGDDDADDDDDDDDDDDLSPSPRDVT